VRCGETAVFSIRDGGSCAIGLPGEWSMKDGSSTHTLKCAPAAGNDPCNGCTGSANFDSCRWTWTAPQSFQVSAQIVAPSTEPCRCTAEYKPGTIRDWLCSGVSSCPNQPGSLDATTCPATQYNGTRRCWLRENWSNVMKLQGLGPAVNGLVLGGGDRTVTLNLAALECACTAWKLDSKAVAIKDPP
jgi:hypothetical protein